MKKYLSLLVVPILALFILGVVSPLKANAGEFHFKTYTLEKDKSVNDDLYIFTNSVNIQGTVYGDLVVFGENVQVSGTVSGDTYLMGATVTVTGDIKGQLYVFAQEASLNGQIVDNVLAFAKTVNYAATSTKDLTVFSYDNIINGTVGDDVRVFAYKSNIDAQIAGDLVLMSETYNVQEEKVAKNIYYNATIKSIAKDQGVDLDKENEGGEMGFMNQKGTYTSKLVYTFVAFVSMLIAGCFLIYLTPVKSVHIIRKITTSPNEFVKSLVVGLVTLLVVPLPIFLLSISFVGAPLAGLLTAFILFVMIFGRVWVELAFGKEILKLFKVKEYRPFKSFLLGRAISSIISLIPIVSGFYSIILLSVSLGAMIRMKKDCFNKK